MEVSQYSNQLLITSIGPVLDFETVKSRVDKQRATDVICSITFYYWAFDNRKGLKLWVNNT